jgi:hypothetical protein
VGRSCLCINNLGMILPARDSIYSYYEIAYSVSMIKVMDLDSLGDWPNG